MSATCSPAPTAISRLIGPAPSAFRTEVVADRASTPDSKGMAATAGATPKSRSAAFGDLDHRTVAVSDRGGDEPSTGCARKRECESKTQNRCLYHDQFLPRLQEAASVLSAWVTESKSETP